MKSQIVSFLYLYGVGGLLFASTLFLAWKRGALDLQSRTGKRMFFFLLGGYLFYIAYHAITQFVLPYAVAGS